MEPNGSCFYSAVVAAIGGGMTVERLQHMVSCVATSSTVDFYKATTSSSSDGPWFNGIKSVPDMCAAMRTRYY